MGAPGVRILCVANRSLTMADINLQTTPMDARFPNVNQARHCYMRYNEFWRCQAEKGEGNDACEKMKKFYMSICPAEWTEKWNEQRENGRFPGPTFEAKEEH